MLDLLLRSEFQYDRQAYVDYEMTLADGRSTERIVQQIVAALSALPGKSPDTHRGDA
jgi:hypothetical protein